MTRTCFITADRVGGWEGGASVCAQEARALEELTGEAPWVLSEKQLSGRIRVNDPFVPPWGWDALACGVIIDREEAGGPPFRVSLAHLYAGTFTQTVNYLKMWYGCPVTYTIAAHDRAVSKKAHEDLGLPFPYPHLVEEELWRNYIGGYLLADCIICPSEVAKKTVRAYPYAGRIEVIPHGCELPEVVRPLPKDFRVGYLGACGPDKGVVHLLRAWKKLNYRDATLVLCGQAFTQPWAIDFVRAHGGGNVELRGWQKDVSSFYNEISLLVQPSMTEGFGITVLEAMAHARPVLCSDGAGAGDLLPPGWVFPAGNAERMCTDIDGFRQMWPDVQTEAGALNRDIASRFTWDKTRARYVKLWRELLGETDA